MTKRIAHRVTEFDSAKIRRAFEVAKKFQGAIDLSIGFPEENTPEAVKLAGIRAIQDNRTRYEPTNGLPALREAIAAKLNRENKVAASAEEVTVTPGLTTAILLCYLALLNPGDEILLPEPLFPPYYDLAKMIGAKPIMIDTAPSFQLTADMVEAQATNSTKILVINSPNNPTGAVYAEEELRAIAEVAKKRNIIIISDEIYEYFSYEKPHFSIGSIYPDTLTLNGFSKAFAMTGWRIGYVHGPADIVDAINQLQQYVVFSSSSIGQYAALEALEHRPTDIRNRYKDKRDSALGLLAESFSDINGAEGAFYLFLKLPDGFSDSVFTERLAEEGVITIPGSAFCRHKDYIRLSYGGKKSDIERGIKIINATLHKQQ